MIFEVEGNRYRIWFKHEVLERPVIIDISGKSRKIRGTTYCYLEKLAPKGDATGIPSDSVNLGVGFAHCAVTDVYNKEKGRQVSLRRALELAWPEKEHHPRWEVAFNAYSHRAKGRKHVQLDQKAAS
jgi:hypothetical protein